MKEKKAKGQFFTPILLVKEIIKRLIIFFPSEFSENTIDILDPAIGKGVFFEAIVPLISRTIPSASFYGLDIDKSVLKTANRLANQIMSKSQYKINIKHGNFLFNSFFSNKIHNFDIILGNPPHNARYSKFELQKIRENCLNEKYPFKTSESAIFFTIRSLKLLKTGGILCFILPKPLIYSKRWTSLRKYLLSNFNLLEVLDLGNQFSGQLQEQCAIIVKKENSNLTNQKIRTGNWNPAKMEFENFCTITNSSALKVDNLLIGVNDTEMKLISRLYGEEYRFLEIDAYRGLSSKYRSKEENIPIIEKANIGTGFLLPPRNFVNENVPKKHYKRQKKPKIIAQRIISYRTQPNFILRIKVWVDNTGTQITHETVVNITPKSSAGLSNETIAGLLQSSFVEWWLRLAVYTKRFVTSKDFDKSYIQSIRIPRKSGSINRGYRKKLRDALDLNQYNEVLKELPYQSNFCILYVLGELFKKYQNTGEKIKNLIVQILNYESANIEQNLVPSKIKSDFQKFKWLYHKLKVNDKFFKKKSELLRQKAESLKKFRNEQQQIKKYIDEVTFCLYKISPQEQKIIEQEI
ncbi:MAG: HsdM family class I SAM-dependent methyltransferase [Candidatus Hodarchaeales archaeon]